MVMFSYVGFNYFLLLNHETFGSLLFYVPRQQDEVPQIYDPADLYVDALQL